MKDNITVIKQKEQGKEYIYFTGDNKFFIRSDTFVSASDMR